ncbi:MAG: hypothetical protein ABSE41_14440 [Bacteroidota bacterium]
MNLLAYRSFFTRVSLFLVLVIMLADVGKSQTSQLDLPDSELVVAYQQAAKKNVLAAVNPKVFFGYWSVCADGKGFGYGNTYPSLDGHQLTDALLWLGQFDVVKANWDYVRSFQRKDGLLPLAILPSLAGKMVGPEGTQSPVAPNGGLYKHWVPGNPLEALASTTYIQNADVIYRHTLDQPWLLEQLSSINLAADYLDSLTTDQGAVRGAGYYVERPARIESDGVTQCHAVDALRRVAALNRIAGNGAAALRYDRLADRIQRHFVTRFWVNDHFAEYLHPQRGLIASHGLTDVDWVAIATGLATPEQQAILWPQLKDEKRFHYGGMPTGISTRPETYEAWEFTFADRYDLAAMGRVWYLEAWARARMGDAQGLLDGLRKVSQVGRENGYSWHERYQPDSIGGVRAAGPDTYCEYPANLIRIVQEFLMGVEMRLDGSIVLVPMVTERYWQKGFGQIIEWQGRSLRYRMLQDRVEGTYTGNAPLRIGVQLPSRRGSVEVHASIDGRRAPVSQEEARIFVTLPATDAKGVCRFEIVRSIEAKE